MLDLTVPFQIVINAFEVFFTYAIVFIIFILVIRIVMSFVLSFVRSRRDSSKLFLN